MVKKINIYTGLYEEVNDNPLTTGEALYVAQRMSSGMACPRNMVERFYNPPVEKPIIPKIPQIDNNIKLIEPQIKIHMDSTLNTINNFLNDKPKKKKNIWDID